MTVEYAMNTAVKLVDTTARPGTARHLFIHIELLDVQRLLSYEAHFEEYPPAYSSSERDRWGGIKANSEEAEVSKSQ